MHVSLSDPRRLIEAAPERCHALLQSFGAEAGAHPPAVVLVMAQMKVSSGSGLSLSSVSKNTRSASSSYSIACVAARLSGLGLVSAA